MKMVKLNVGNRHITDPLVIETRLAYFIRRNGSIDRFWGEACLTPKWRFRFKFYFAKISGYFEIQFEDIDEFTAFLGTLNIAEHANNDTKMYFFLMHGNEKGEHHEINDKHN